MTDNPRPRSAMQLAEQGLRRAPRRDPAAGRPRITEADQLDPEELARARAQLARGSRPSKFVRGR